MNDIFQIFAFTSMSVVIISTVTFVLSTMPELTDNIDIMLFDNETDILQNSTEVPLIAPVERWEEVRNPNHFIICYFMFCRFLRISLSLLPKTSEVLLILTQVEIWEQVKMGEIV